MKLVQVLEKKNKEESRVAIELRKHYEQAKARSEKLTKERTQMEAQMKKLFE